jgi:hypothetical protein
MRWSCTPGIRRSTSSDGDDTLGASEQEVPGEEGISMGARSAMASVG